MDKLKSIIDIIDYFGEDNMKLKAIGRMSELTGAICREDIDIREKIADVYIVLSYLQIIYGFSMEKIERIRKRFV